MDHRHKYLTHKGEIMILTIESVNEQIKALEQMVTQNQIAYNESVGALKSMIHLREYLEKPESSEKKKE
jgi:tetrahydromethanopterin S-methyltransferase subunit B